MNYLARLSEADSLALHGMAVLSAREGKLTSVKEIAELLQVSYSHLREVFHRLEKAGIIQGTSGPWGGYRLARSSEKISLLEIYEALEGKFRPRDCLLEKRTCQGKECLMGDFIKKMNREFQNYLAKTKLSEFKNLYPNKKGGKDEKKDYQN